MIKISRMSCTVRKVASVGDSRTLALPVFGSPSRTTSRMPTGFNVTQFSQNSVDPVYGHLVTRVHEFHLCRGIHDDTPIEFSSGPSANFGVDAAR
jgi:hypothetical protein